MTCTLKAIRREIAQELELIGEMHRFIPILAHQRGARCVEVVTRHHPRIHGTTKYGINRTFRVLLDLFTVNYLVNYAGSPMKFFGRVGLWTGAAALLAAMITLTMKMGWAVAIGTNPLWLASLALVLATMQSLGLGLLAEVQTRLRMATGQTTTYSERELVNFDIDSSMADHDAPSAHMTTRDGRVNARSRRAVEAADVTTNRLPRAA